MQRIVIASDHAGFELKSKLVGMLRERGYEVLDLGCESTESVDYPDYAHQVASRIATGDCPRGVLVCGTGVGMAMAANRHAGVRAAVCPDPEFARLAREHNDANVLCMSGRHTAPEAIEPILDTWLRTGFAGGRHQKRIDKLDAASTGGRCDG